MTVVETEILSSERYQDNEMPLVANERWNLALSVIEFLSSRFDSVKICEDQIFLTALDDSDITDESCMEFLRNLHFLTGMNPVIQCDGSNKFIINP